MGSEMCIRDRFNKGDEVSRRQFMIGAARNCLGVSVLPMLGSTIATNDTFAAAPPMRRGAAKSVIFSEYGWRNESFGHI